MNHELIAKILEYLDFVEVIRIVKCIPDGENTILPQIKHIYSSSSLIQRNKLIRCCRAEKLCLPYSNYIDTNVLLKMPLLKSLTIRSGAKIDWFVFEYLQNLRVIQILSAPDKDTIIGSNALDCLKKLEYLYICSDKITENNLKKLTQLKVLILKKSQISPAIINYLPKLEVLIINRILYKYRHTLRNIGIIKRIGYINKIKIWNTQ